MTLRAAVGAVASDARIAEAATAALHRGGTAVDACISAWFAAAGVFPGVLLGPLHILVSGPGVGAHATDGSVLQPGRDVQRPRGFKEGDPIPDAAYVAVSCSVHAMTAAHAQDGRISLVELASAGVKLALSEGAKERAALIRRIGEVGVLATREQAFVRPLLDVGGRPLGGNLTAMDIDCASAVTTRSDATSGMLRVREQTLDAPVDIEPMIACACDVRGVLAVMHCAYDPKGLKVEPLELEAPRLAVPVRRGVPRVSPGTYLPVAAPIALMLDASVPWAAVGVETHREADFAAVGTADTTGLTMEQSLRTVLESVRARAAIAVIRGGGANATVRIVRVIA